MSLQLLAAKEGSPSPRFLFPRGCPSPPLGNLYNPFLEIRLPARGQFHRSLASNARCKGPPSPQRTRTILESWTPWPLLAGLAHAGNEGSLWAAHSPSDSGCTPPPHAPASPSSRAPGLPMPRPHRVSNSPARQPPPPPPPAETRGSAGAREAGDSSITSARRRSQSAAGPRPGRMARSRRRRCGGGVGGGVAPLGVLR